MSSAATHAADPSLHLTQAGVANVGGATGRPGCSPNCHEVDTAKRLVSEGSDWEALPARLAGTTALATVTIARNRDRRQCAEEPHHTLELAQLRGSEGVWRKMHDVVTDLANRIESLNEDTTVNFKPKVLPVCRLSVAA